MTAMEILAWAITILKINFIQLLKL
jgi:hypothetical protein